MTNNAVSQSQHESEEESGNGEDNDNDSDEAESHGLKKPKIMLGTWPLGEEKKTPARDEIYYTTRYQKHQNGTTGERIGRFLALAEANRAVIASLDEYGDTT